MNINEKPLENPVRDGGFCKIFRSIACIGDSLSSGEFESTYKDGSTGYHDMFDYSWGQFIARDCNSKVYNFSQGGMTARAYCDSFAEEKGFWGEDKKAQAYIIALGVNDVSCVLDNAIEFGDVSDIDFDEPENCKKTFIGYYGKIIAKYRKMQPRAKFFLMSTPNETDIGEERRLLYGKLSECIGKISEMIKNVYVIDFWKYAPDYDAEFKRSFFLGSHMNPMGYVFTATMVESYIDYIIRHNPDDFKEVAYIGTDLHHKDAKPL
ncbi:MAG: SGNH/GDSL hydrolase family protein [Clostridia bacterium]|nr:SGNH/GDSL hydrolase family protein [Clostridia bacterium]